MEPDLDTSLPSPEGPVAGAAPRAQARGPRGWRHVYHLARMVQNYAEADLELFGRYGDVVRLRLPKRSVCFFRPSHVKHILRTNVLNYPKSDEYDLLRPILGDGIFVSEGDLWTRQRRLLAPEFRENTVARFVPAIVASAEQLFAEWDARLRQGPIDVTADMMRLTLWAVGRTMFKSEFLEEAEVIGDCLEVCLTHATRQMLSMGLYPSWLPTRGNREARAAERELNAVIMAIIQRGRGDQVGGYDVLSRMIHAKDPESGTSMSDAQLLDETKSLVLAGHETTSLALSWAFYLLARHPEIESRLVEEAQRGLSDATPTAAAIGALDYTRAVFLETMRLYPPVPAVSRNVLEPDAIDGVDVRTNEFAVIAPYVTHRHPEYWPDPLCFDPERFSAAGAERIEPYSYLPFLLGRRACLGEHFAMLEGVLLLAMIVRRYRLTLVEAAPIAVRPISTLRFARPLVMRVTPRDAPCA